MIEKLVDQIEARFQELSEQMSDPEVIGDRQRYAEVGRAYRQLEPAHELAVEYRRVADDAAGARELIEEGLEDDETAHALLARADDALYEAKHSGRNRVCGAPSRARTAP